MCHDSKSFGHLVKFNVTFRKLTRFYSCPGTFYMIVTHCQGLLYQVHILQCQGSCRLWLMIFSEKLHVFCVLSSILQTPTVSDQSVCFSVIQHHLFEAFVSPLDPIWPYYTQSSFVQILCTDFEPSF